MIIRKRVDSMKLDRKNYIVLCGEFALEEAVDLSQGRQRHKLNLVVNKASLGTK